MTLRSTSELQNPNGLKDIVTELQGLRVVAVNGAAASTKMDVPAIRSEDTILEAIILADTWAAPTSDVANVSIVDTHASGTLTISGDPLDDETFVVNGVTYTFKTTPTQMTHVKITAGDNNTMAAAVASAVNSYETRKIGGIGAGSGNMNTPGVVATVATNVVTFKSYADGAGNGPVVTKNGAPITLSAADPGAVTATLVSVVATNDITVNGVTFTARAAISDVDLDFLVEATDAEQAVELARVINAYQQKYGGTLNAVASAATNVVTITAASARTGNTITLTEAATNVAVSGSGFLAGGSDTGGITSSTDNSTNTLLLIWYDKNP